MEQFTVIIKSGIWSNDGSLVAFNECYFQDKHGNCHIAKLEGYLVGTFETDKHNNEVLSELSNPNLFLRTYEDVQKKYPKQFEL